MRPAARGATNDSPSSARCARGYGPLRERRRAPLRSAGAKRETHLTTDAISVNEGAFASVGGRSLRSAGAKRETHVTTDAISVNEGAFREARRTTQLPAPVRERNA